MTETTRPRRFSPDERAALAVLLDSIVPASDDGRMPSAGALAIESDVEDALDQMPELKAMIEQSLAALHRMATARDPRGLAALSAGARAELFHDLESGEHAFPPVLVLQTYAAYYGHPRVLELLGMEPRAPHPKGYEMKPNDLELLEPVRRRAPMYRKA